jgi:hypothetical protein
MKIQLIKGSFSSSDATELITELIEVKIKFHENKISNTHNEEDVKMRESRIKQLQNDLHEVRKYINGKDANVELVSEIDMAD